MKYHYAAGLNLGRQGSKGGGGVRKKLKNEAANNCIEWGAGRSPGHVRFNKAHIAKPKLRRSCPRLLQSNPVEINANYFAGRSNESGHKECNITEP